MATEREQIEAGIAAYGSERDYLKEFLSDWKSQAEFDHRFNSPGPVRTMARAVTPESFVLGGMYGGQSQWWLDLMQHMITLGEVEDEERDDGFIWYRTAVSARWDMIDEAVRRYGAYRAAKDFNIHPDGGKWRDDVASRKCSNATACIRAEFRILAAAGRISIF